MLIAIFFFGFSLMLYLFQVLFPIQTTSKKVTKRWEVESIDTMKYSRDLSRQYLTDGSAQVTINKQVSAIAATGATHVAIDTPYDSEFLPVLKMWVQAGRSHGLHIWFRGNFSGWEGWFGYPKIDEQTHIQKVQQFILANKDLFEDGDIFTSCPECENGIQLQIGDPTAVAPYRSFLIDEYRTTKRAFALIGKNVINNYFSMNADAARAIMDRVTTQSLGGVVVIDHYVPTPDDLANDVSSIANQSGGKIVLGEFGAPIPDIQGNMTEEQQKEWLQKSLHLLSNKSVLIGINYWVNVGGSTALWRDNGLPKPVVSILSKYYQNNL
ncbi:MAG TPA: hypothetical protein VNW29_01845 [Candidatus Sulfotelmatobacter sp.]|nr:hypothetical protein [Candidatus Sulfotelmatobacter sp.]